MRIDSNNNIRMTRGDSESITVSCEQLPFEDGDEVRLTVRKSKYNGEKVIEKIVTEFVEGKAIIEIQPADTSHMGFREYIYDIQLTRADGAVTTIIKPAKFYTELEVSYDE